LDKQLTVETEKVIEGKRGRERESGRKIREVVLPHHHAERLLLLQYTFQVHHI